MTILTANAAIDQLVTEGFDRDDVLAAVDSLILAGLDASQTDDEHCLINPDDVAVLRAQLNAPRD